MISLAKGTTACVEIKPRWPDKQLVIDEATLEKLGKAQSLLPASIRLVLTRAYQPERLLQKMLRNLGQCFFCILYPARFRELSSIFGHNGHATGGRHIDIAIRYDGNIIRLLPLGVFTPAWMLQRKEQQYAYILLTVWKRLMENGFIIHSNRTESLQIHCDFTPA